MFSWPIGQGRAVQRSAGFTLVELLVVITIIGILMSLLLPAVQQIRAAARRIQCGNHLKQLALAMHNYEAAIGALPPAAISWVGDPIYGTAGRPGPGSWYDDHGWYSQIGPYIEQQAWYDSIDFTKSFSHEVNDQPRRHEVPLYACPSDGFKKNEWDSRTWARLRGNYVVNFGNTNYGQTEKAGVKFLGAPFRPLKSQGIADVRDGSSNTLMMAEILTVLESNQCSGCWGSPLSDFSTSLGGQTFNGWLPPNSPVGDDVARRLAPEPDYTLNDIPYPNRASHSVDQSFAARSHHNGGVQGSYCDASVHFFNDGIDAQTWAALSSARGGEVVSVDQ